MVTPKCCQELVRRHGEPHCRARKGSAKLAFEGEGDGVIDPGSDAEVAALLATFFEQTSDFVGVADGWGGVLYLNPAAQKRLGIIEVEGVSLADLFPPETFRLYYDVIRPALLRSGAWSGEILVNAAGSTPVPMRVSTVARIGPGGKVDGSVMVGHEPV